MTTRILDTNYRPQNQQQQQQHQNSHRYPDTRKTLLSHDWMMNLFFHRRSGSTVSNSGNHKSQQQPQQQQQPPLVVPLAPPRGNHHHHHHQLVVVDNAISPESETTVRKPGRFARVSSRISSSRSLSLSRGGRRRPPLAEKPTTTTTSVADVVVVPEKEPPSRTISFVSADQLMDDPLRGQVPSVVHVGSALQRTKKKKIVRRFNRDKNCNDNNNDDDVSEVSLDDFEDPKEEGDQQQQIQELVLQAKLAELGLATGLKDSDYENSSLDENLLLQLSSSCSSSTTPFAHGDRWQQQQHQTNEAWGMTTLSLEEARMGHHRKSNGEWPSDEDKSPFKKKKTESKLLGEDIRDFESGDVAKQEVNLFSQHSNIIWTTEDDGAIETVQVLHSGSPREACDASVVM
mmetsp:Transcript_2415/g.4981  ORF Transcript_2415/g.4981 Transcript_2415/m.4981 type:complete len:402 (+) Transcript_2415:598-1803(+)|eukprot:CAMPEP_0168733970 /NCGR_PEP_ID=MMETSP0724-20121128/8570_1 /TAXON_ID=265536 /ORGANISM="Amphiprora sp., Strain CCMP467" /LENGTH=401 /DNA_ID=CAMNT_0008781055 /DNA_START=456 /DNA_END=1661 /DNA_ORIENTATION=+